MMLAERRMTDTTSMLKSTGFSVTYTLYGYICHVLYQNMHTLLTITRVMITFVTKKHL